MRTRTESALCTLRVFFVLRSAPYEVRRTAHFERSERLELHTSGRIHVEPAGQWGRPGVPGPSQYAG
eukprot:2649435-Alexandrium_andersonii.AAC.1